MATLIDGKAVAKTIRKELAASLASVPTAQRPKLVVVLVGDDPASAIYVRNKERACQKVGIAHETIRHPATMSEDELLALVHQLNSDQTVHGILVQLPLPPHIDAQKILLAIDPAKDVDGFHPVSVGKMVVGAPTLLPCTPAGVIELLDRYNIPIAGKHAVVLGRSNIVGKPAALLLLQRNATVTICHSRTADLAAHTRQADILIAAVGKPGMVTADMVKNGTVVIDVGTNHLERDGETKLVGDVDFAAVEAQAQAITPVPGGVGPMTIAMLLRNVCTAAGFSQ